jgi:hypothetical protein
MCFAGVFVLGMLAACKEPMSDDPGYKATVLCNNTMKGQGGARNESKALCIGLVGDRFRAQPQGHYDDLAKCILQSADEKSARECK